MLNPMTAHTLALRFDEWAPVRATKGDIGIEIECELNRMPTEIESPEGTWTVHEDGSLRNIGCEFVLRRPIMAQNLNKALREWKAWTEDLQFMPSLRTSVHVHINVQKKTLQEIYTILAVAWVVENLLVRFSGPDREGNLFCLRIKDADYTVNKLIQGLENQTFFGNTRDDNFRYASTNLTALYKFGSIEFRSMRGIYEIVDIEEWTKAIYQMTENACRRYNNPKEVVDMFLKEGAREFLYSIFDRQFADKLMKFPDYQEIMEENFGYALELAQAISWPTLKDKLKAKREEVKEPFPGAARRQAEVDEVIGRIRRRQRGVQAANPFEGGINVFGDPIDDEEPDDIEAINDLLDAPVPQPIPAAPTQPREFRVNWDPAGIAGADNWVQMDANGRWVINGRL